MFVVGCFGNWESAAKVLFEPESLRRDIKKGRSKKQEATTGFIPSVANCLQTTCNDYSRADGFNMIAFENSRRDGVRLFGDVSNTLQSFMGTRGGNVPCVALAENTIGRQPQNGGNGDGFTENGPMYTLNATGVHGVAQFVDVYNQAVDGQVSATMTSACGGTNTSGPKIMQNMAVRKLTPVECERLQGFPDNYTNIKENCPDGPRYKALGNSMAVPVMKWIGKRIANV